MRTPNNTPGVLRLAGVLTLMVGALILAGCSDDTTNPAPTTATAELDAAAAIASDLAADEGGLVDQLNDAVGFAGGVDLSIKSGDGQCEGLREADYDEASGTWTITVERERGEPGTVPYAVFTRVFTLRFLNEGGLAQQHYVTEGDTATTIEFDIVSGTGEHVTRHVTHLLTGLTGAFVVTDADQELVTINGTYFRSGENSLENQNFSRLHVSSLDLELIDVVAPRGGGRDLSGAVSGSAVGTYTADITIERGDDYIEKSIVREFSIDFGDGEALMQMGGNSYRTRLRDGELVGN